MLNSFKLIILSVLSTVFMITVAHAEIVIVDGQQYNCTGKTGTPGTGGCSYSSCRPNKVAYDPASDPDKISCNDCEGAHPSGCSTKIAGTTVKCKPLNSGSQQRFLCEKPKKATSVRTSAGKVGGSGSKKGTNQGKKPRGKKPRGKKPRSKKPRNKKKQ